jgi:serine protease Do
LKEAPLDTAMQMSQYQNPEKSLWRVGMFWHLSQLWRRNRVLWFAGPMCLIVCVAGQTRGQEPASEAQTVVSGADRNAISDAAQRENLGSLSPESHARALSLAFRDAARKALPSVVTILARSKRPGEDSSVLDIISGSDDSLFDSVGSGVIIGPDGLILTNHHVIADTSRVEVRLSDGRQYAAVEQLSDPSSDVALVRITPSEPLSVAEIGMADAMQVGDWVLAIGSPFTLESSVSAGIISGTNRRQQLSKLVSGQFLQTDAAINPGNSGGPLIDLEGKVIGINTAISSRSGGFQGIGFAIPIDRAVWIKTELLEYGKVRRGYAGVRTSDVPYQLARSLELPVAGALINAVVPDYPGDKAGLLSGDVIVQFGESMVRGKNDFQDMVQQSPIGEPIALKVIRNSEEVDLTIVLQERRQ